VIGHESLGEVVEVGPEVSGLRPGDLVVRMVRRPCPHAHYRSCRAGRQDFCSTGGRGQISHGAGDRLRGVRRRASDLLAKKVVVRGGVRPHSGARTEASAGLLARRHLDLLHQHARAGNADPVRRLGVRAGGAEVRQARFAGQHPSSRTSRARLPRRLAPPIAARCVAAPDRGSAPSRRSRATRRPPHVAPRPFGASCA